VDGQRHTEKIHLELAVWMSPSLGPHAFGIGWTPGSPWMSHPALSMKVAADSLAATHGSSFFGDQGGNGLAVDR
jgi:hypothetical protein